MMIKPQYLKKGDSIGIIAPAGKISKDSVKPSINVYKRWGLKVILGQHLFYEHFQFAGTTEQRLSDLQNMLDDISIKAIVCARGGYGLIHLIDKIDFTHFIKHPKWIIGFSDIGILHSHIHQNFERESMHATMPVNMAKNTAESLKSLQNALFGKDIIYILTLNSYCRKGEAKGILVGGNLSVLYSLLGSVSDIDTKNKILFLEDVDEYLYHIERMMLSLKRAGKFNNLAALMIGGLSRLKDNAMPFGKNAKEIIRSIVEDYNFPVLFDFPAGHQNDNRALIFGREAFLSVQNEKTVFLQKKGITEEIIS